MLAGRFRLLGRTSLGASGTVYRAEDTVNGGLCAIKLLHKDSRFDAARFALECSTLASLRDPGIVQYVANGFTGEGKPFLAMEWVEGPSLDERLKQAPLTLRQGIELVRRLGVALGAMHERGFVHRDLRPGNVVLVDGDPTYPKLIDMGIVRTSTRITTSGMLVGTPGYMSPEQARGDRDVDSRADVFALGCLLFKCITGQTPFQGEEALAGVLKVLVQSAPRLSELCPDVPVAIDDAVARMLSQERDARPRDGLAVAELLGAASESDEPVTDIVTGSSSSPRTRLVTCVVAGRPRPSAPAPTPGSKELSARLAKLEPALGRLQARHGVLADGTLVVSFGSPGATPPELALRGARCALALGHALPEMRFAVATGAALDVGATTPKETVDRAVTLLERRGDDDSTAIALDDASASLVETNFVVTRTADGTQLRSEIDLEALCRVGGKNLPCQGREQELGELVATFEECLALKRPRIALLTGVEGIGKSRLRWELQSRLQAEHPDLAIWSAQADPLSAGTPFGLVRSMLRRLAGILDGTPRDDRRRRMRTLVRQMVGAADIERVTDFLGELAGALGATTDESRSAHRDPASMSGHLHQAFTELLLGACLHGPVCIVLENLHWGDAPSVSLLDAAIAACHEQGLFVLAVARPEVDAAIPTLWHRHKVQEIRLEPLHEAASVRLVRQILGPEPPDEVVEQIVETGAGVPLLLEELTRTAVVEGELSHATSLPEVARARLERLPAERAKALGAAALLGQRFSCTGVGVLLRRDCDAGVQSCMEQLVQDELLVPCGASRFPGEHEYAFRQASMQEVAYAMLGDQERELGHRLAAAWLKAARETDPVLLAVHLERGGLASNALPWWRRAAQLSLDGGDLPQAFTRAYRAVACGATGETLGVLKVLTAEVLLRQRAFPAAGRTAREALDLLPAGSPPYCRAAALAIIAACRRKDSIGVASAVAKLMALGPEGDARPERAAALGEAARALVLLDELGSADKVLARLEKVGDRVLADDVAAASVLAARAARAKAADDIESYEALAQAAAERTTPPPDDELDEPEEPDEPGKAGGRPSDAPSA